jgi:pantoate kinase
VGEFNPQDLVNIVWRLAKAGHAAPAMFDAIAAPRVVELNPQELANTAWSLAVADAMSSAALGDVVCQDLAAAALWCGLLVARPSKLQR